MQMSCSQPREERTTVLSFSVTEKESNETKQQHSKTRVNPLLRGDAMQCKIFLQKINCTKPCALLHLQLSAPPPRPEKSSCGTGIWYLVMKTFVHHLKLSLLVEEEGLIMVSNLQRVFLLSSNGYGKNAYIPLLSMEFKV